MYRFHDKKIDTNLFLQLQDLTTVLSREPDLHFDYSYGSYLDVTDKKVTASTFWDLNDPNLKAAGYKTDIYLRILGNLHYTAIQPLRNFMEDRKSTRLNSSHVAISYAAVGLNKQRRAAS